MNGPRLLRPPEYDPLVALCSLCFPGERPEGVLARWPHVFSNRRALLRNSVVFEDRGKIVGHVGVWPATLVVQGSKISAAGITYVATHPEYRGRGLMARGLDYAVGLMKRRGVAVSWLIGDRLRYGLFGWENAGRKYYFTIPERSVGRLPATGATIREFHGEPDLLDALQRLHARREIRLERTRAQARLVFNRAGKTTYLAFRNGVPVSYVSVEKSRWAPEQRLVYEHGGGPDGFGDLLREVFSAHGCRHMTVSSPMGDDPCLPPLFEAASIWRLDTCFIEFSGAGHMLKIIDLHAVVSGFCAQMNRRRSQIGATKTGAVTLVVAETGQRSTLRFGKTVTATRVPAGERIVLSEAAMVRLLFGLSRPAAACSALLDAVFPLDFYVSPLEDL